VTAEIQAPIDQRTRILEATGSVLALRGYDGVRLRDIAGAAGVSVGMLQHYFDGREELLEAAFERHCTQALEGFAVLRTTGTDAWVRIAAVIHHIAAQPDAREQAIIWIEFVAAASRHEQLQPPLQRVYRTWRQTVQEAVAEGVATGLFSPRLPVEATTDVLLTHFDGCLMALTANVGFLDQKRFLELSLQASASILNFTPGVGPEEL
jgi:AcrR family transcriptional regulator